MESAQVPNSRWVMKKMWYIYIVEHYLAIKRNQIVSFAEKCMEVEIIM
jgi:hypothetical protein